MSRVFVVDDDADVRTTLCALLESEGYAARGFGSAADFRARRKKDAQGCLVLDVQLPRQCGLDFYKQLMREGTRLPVIFISGRADITTTVAAMKAGAVEFLEKPFDHQTLLNSIKRAFELGSLWRQRELAFLEIEERMVSLTPRESETLDLILAGESNKSMAATLFLTERAVEMRRAAIMRKLHVRTLADLLHVSISHRMLSEFRRDGMDELGTVPLRRRRSTPNLLHPPSREKGRA